ncbi:hypothetical protein [Mycobacterium sp. IDR2000157661]|uniref:hypothetical protein n=1 Tax=Mycobacterium sp. IDR2000157661 TaxID=2867005 RepID=UPI001EEC69D5|nr:hypothetical protein [Mycobacterium sp. IDR2000157661]ULE32740.1 hypothetical protein K3G64_22060 [Mycobacterium sp. IDR2000157661]
MTADHAASWTDDSPGAAAAQRVAELRDLNARLKAGGRVTAVDVEAAARHAHEAHERARRAHLVAAQRHRRAAWAHDRAAQMHRTAAASGVGDVVTHLRAIEIHEAARDEDCRAAEVAQRMADSE